jgi:hypothetical protein
MTTITTALGALPLALATGPRSELEPIYPQLPDEAIDRVIAEIRAYFRIVKPVHG